MKKKKMITENPNISRPDRKNGRLARYRERLEKENLVNKGKIVVIAAGASALECKTQQIYSDLVTAARRAELI